MNLHTLIKHIENDTTFIKLIELGVIPINVLDKKVYYERYLQERRKESKMQSVTNVSEEYGVSESTVRRAIKYMTRY